MIYNDWHGITIKELVEKEDENGDEGPEEGSRQAAQPMEPEA